MWINYDECLTLEKQRELYDLIAKKSRNRPPEPDGPWKPLEKKQIDALERLIETLTETNAAARGNRNRK